MGIYDDKHNKIGEKDCDWYKPEVFQGDETNGQNTLAYTQAVNAQGLCGSSNWRLPTKSELESLVYCSNGKYKTLNADEAGHICDDSASYPFINTYYFPDRNTDAYLSSSPSTLNATRNFYYDRDAWINDVWTVMFSFGDSESSHKSYNGSESSATKNL